MSTLEVISTSMGIVGGLLGSIAFFRDSFGSFKVIVDFEKGNDAYPTKNYIERHTNLVVKVIKKGRIKQSISSATIETRILNAADGSPVNLNPYINLDNLIGAPLEQNEVRICKYDFISRSNHGMEGLLTMVELRLHIIDTRSKVYSSDWASYIEYVSGLETNLPLGDILP